MTHQFDRQQKVLFVHLKRPNERSDQGVIQFDIEAGFLSAVYFLEFGGGDPIAEALLAHFAYCLRRMSDDHGMRAISELRTVTKCTPR